MSTRQTLYDGLLRGPHMQITMSGIPNCINYCSL